MATIFRSICILQLLFISSCFAYTPQPGDFEELNEHHVLGPHELFGDPFGDPNDYTKTPVDDSKDSKDEHSADSKSFNAPVMIFDEPSTSVNGDATSNGEEDDVPSPNGNVNDVRSSDGDGKDVASSNGDAKDVPSAPDTDNFPLAPDDYNVPSPNGNVNDVRSSDVDGKDVASSNGDAKDVPSAPDTDNFPLAPDDYNVPSAPMDADDVSSSPVDDVSSDHALDPQGLDKEKGNGPNQTEGNGGKGWKPKVVITTAFKGNWELVSQNSGVSAMHAMLLPKVDKVLMFDSSIWKISKVKLNGECHLVNITTGEKDCWAHSVLFDIYSYQLTPLLIKTDTWCSSGGLSPEGNIISTGGFQGGANSVRYLDTCEGCGWRDYPGALAARRWYSTQAALPDGSFIVVGGRESFSYEYIPREGARNPKPIFFKFLQETNDPEENNLYPFVHLNTDGNFFIFANSRSLLLNPKTQQIVREFPELKGGHRSYPATGLSALLPIKLHLENNAVIPAEVLICGGSAHKDSYSAAEKKTFYTALHDCARMRITDPDPVWKSEIMPSPRIMGDAMMLPTGDVLLLNGAKRGSSGWGFAREPNFTPALYNPTAKLGSRFTALAPSNIPRMYHATAVVLPSGKVLVSGSNTNNGYLDKAMYPTELRVEYFSPPYLAPELVKFRPEISEGNSNTKFGYGQTIKFQITLNAESAATEDIEVTMNSPPFTTHGVSMNQRLLNLGLQKIEKLGASKYNVVAVAPPSGAIAPPGYYMLSVIYRGVPSIAKWVQIK